MLSETIVLLKKMMMLFVHVDVKSHKILNVNLITVINLNFYVY